MISKDMPNFKPLVEAYELIRENEDEAMVLFTETIPKALWKKLKISAPSVTPNELTKGVCFVYDVDRHPKVTPKLIDQITQLINQLMTTGVVDSNTMTIKVVTKQNPFKIIIVLIPNG